LTESSWTIVYKEALSAGPDNFLSGIHAAGEAIHARLRTLFRPSTEADVRELRELCVALSDLYVLKTSFQHHSGVASSGLLS
jgi:hypothetical protein